MHLIVPFINIGLWISLSQLEISRKISKPALSVRPIFPISQNPYSHFLRDPKILIVGQALEMKVQETGIPWNDTSGDRLRDWMQVSKEQFYDTKYFSIVPMAFCYPGKGKSGDLPPPIKCAET